MPCLAGSGALMLHCMNHLFSVDRLIAADWVARDCSVAQLHQTVSVANPLALIGVEKSKLSKVKKLVQKANNNKQDENIFIIKRG